MPTVRDRNRSKTLIGSGTANGVTTVQNATVYYERNTDVVGNRQGDNAFTKETRDLTGISPINGAHPTQPSAHHVDGWHCTLAIGHASLTHPVSLTWQDVAARSNVNRPDINPLTLAQDFIELPRALMDVGKYFRPGAGREIRKLRDPSEFARETANHHLATQFGWLPFVDDVKKLLTIQSRVDKRLKRLKSLYNTGGEHRTVRVGSVDKEGLPQTVSLYGAYPSTFYADVSSITTVDRWYSARWKLTMPPPYFENSEALRKHAWRVANGFTIPGLMQGAWDVLPWSFLLDWFFDVGSFLMANANTIPVKMISACEMTETRSRHYFKRNNALSSSYLTGGTGEGVYVTKMRKVLFPGLFYAGLPVLDWWHVSILGSLAIQRLSRR